MENDNQISRTARINFCGEPKTQPIYCLSRKSIYDMAFYFVDENWDDEHGINTTTWD